MIAKSRKDLGVETRHNAQANKHTHNTTSQEERRGEERRKGVGGGGEWPAKSQR